MTDLLLKSNELAYWYAWIDEGKGAAKRDLREDMEGYLACMLMRFVQRLKVSQDSMAIDHGDIYLEPRVRRLVLLREIGDKSLIFASLFSDIAKKYCIQTADCISMGQMAYRLLSNSYQGLEHELYKSLSQQLVQLIEILQAARHYSLLNPFNAIGPDVVREKKLH